MQPRKKALSVSPRASNESFRKKRGKNSENPGRTRASLDAFHFSFSCAGACLLDQGQEGRRRNLNWDSEQKSEQFFAK
jgi:hypothetical protein